MSYLLNHFFFFFYLILRCVNIFVKRVMVEMFVSSRLCFCVIEMKRRAIPSLLKFVSLSVLTNFVSFQMDSLWIIDAFSTD